jgi:magnesium-transporting ATPase (P-type)
VELPGPSERVAHQLPVHEAVLLLETDAERGLSEADARERLLRFGPNRLPAVHRHGALVRFLLQFHNPLIYVLIVAGTVTLVLGQVVDASVIFGVALVNAVIGYIQEARAERALEALTAMLTTEATVVRDGDQRRVVSERLVPGDLVVLGTGDRVPADLRLTEVDELRVDESALTGESAPVAKHSTPLAAEAVVADRLNMAHSGTLATRGHGRGVVVATGAATELGLIHRLIGEAGAVGTPLTRKISRFSKQLTGAILVLAALAFAIGLARGEPASEVFVAVVALAVGAIPEGLPAALTITLAIGVTRMARRHAVVRRLPAVETLGSTTVICTDKTGTLTENQMTVRVIWAGGRLVEVTGTGYSPEGELREDAVPTEAVRGSALAECLAAGALCNDALIEQRDRRWEAVGDPTEAALLVSARKAGIDPERLAAEQPRIDAIPFESARQYMGTLHRPASGAAPRAYFKGSVERVVAMCERALTDAGEEAPIEREAILAEAERLGERGLRVLAFADAPLRPGTSELGSSVPPGLRLLGLQAMQDPPRGDAVSAVARCQEAGIEVKMVTGDHAATAAAIAAEVGLGGDAEQRAGGVMTGPELAAARPERLRSLAEETAVFARVSPEQKLRLVEVLQGRGEIVAMTGDGVNDAPALQQADIGIAMGRSGTEVAKEAGDIVLTDDNFASIEAAVEEGRRIFDNITKFIVWTLPTNIGEGLLILTALAAGVTLPILPAQILWINMTTAVALGLTLAFEAREPDAMSRPPRDPGTPLLTRALIGRILLVSALLLAGSFWLFEWELGRGASDAEARTVAVNVFVMVEVFYLFNCRSLERSLLHIGLFSNRWALAGVGVTVALQLGFTYAPQMQSLFRSAAIGPEAWLRILGVGLVAWVVVGAEKWVRRRRG